MLGVMLPYTPLHHLLFAPVPGADAAAPRALVMTSGNLADEPICTDDAEARSRLADLADAFLAHDRPIHVPCDDSVIRVVDGDVQPVRRSRGYAPLPVALPVQVAPTLAVGGDLKNTFCSRAAGARGSASTSATWRTSRRCTRSNEPSTGSSGCTPSQPTVIASDRHPGYLTRRWAVRAPQRSNAGRGAAPPRPRRLGDGRARSRRRVAGDRLRLRRHRLRRRRRRAESGAARCCVADYAGFDRAGHLRPLPLPGGDAAVRNPCRIALAHLAALGIAVDPSLPAVAACDEVELAVVRRQVRAQRRLRADHQHGPALRRRRLAARGPAPHRLRGAGRDRAGGARRAWRRRPGGAAVGVRARRCGVIDPAPVLRGIVDDVTDGGDRRQSPHSLPSTRSLLPSLAVTRQVARRPRRDAGCADRRGVPERAAHAARVDARWKRKASRC